MGQATIDTETATVCAARKARDADEVDLLHTVIAWSAAHRVDREVVDEITFGDNGVLLGGKAHIIEQRGGAEQAQRDALHAAALSECLGCWPGRA